MTITATVASQSTEPCTITRVLIANRGEIARRIIHTARAMGIATVAVYTLADAGAPHVLEADLAVLLTGEGLAQTYLSSEALIEAARATQADAIHPGYGFLSENASFARAVIDAGITWIGPNPESIEAMGAKITAKEIMAKAKVPILSDLNPATVKDTEFPVLVKASAGGGGRGMRIARSRAEIDEQLAAARSEAGSAFGDDSVFCERYLESGHHVEVQIIADQHGTVWAVGERECSIQRRHQKILEESPSPLVERHPEMREKLFAAARSAAKAIGYVGAGTVEFLATEDGEFFFLEVNTRLQVEHPVSEATSGLDLVRLQIEVAESKPLPTAEPPVATGHAIEARLYAEIPAADYRPSVGVLERLHFPGKPFEFSAPPGSQAYLRVDSVVARDRLEIGTDYDPMIAKVIAYAPGRAAALRSLATALRNAQIHGIDTNRDQLVRIVTHPDFVSGMASTAFLADVGDAVLKPLLDEAAMHRCAMAAALVAESDGPGVVGASRMTRSLRGFRNVGTASRRVAVDLRTANAEQRPRITVELERVSPASEPAFARILAVCAGTHGEAEIPPWAVAITRTRIVDDEQPAAIPAGGTGTTNAAENSGPGAACEDNNNRQQSTATNVVDVLASVVPDAAASSGSRSAMRAQESVTVLLADGGVQRIHRVTMRGSAIDVEGPDGAARFDLVPRHPDPTSAVAAGSLKAPMPGTIIRVAVQEGDTVNVGQPLLWLEAMKMEHQINAPESGIVKDLSVTVGAKVDAGTSLVRIETEEPS